MKGAQDQKRGCLWVLGPLTLREVAVSLGHIVVVIEAIGVCWIHLPYGSSHDYEPCGANTDDRGGPATIPTFGEAGERTRGGLLA